MTGVNNQLLNDGTYSCAYDGEGNRTRRTHSTAGADGGTNALELQPDYEKARQGLEDVLRRGE